jgi:hypothetical protein
LLYYTNYLIRPNQNLLESDEVDESFLEILSEPVIFENSQGGITSWRQDDYFVLVKIFFLASLKNDYDHPFLLNLLLSEASFDKWWHIENIPEKITRREAIADWGDERLKELIPTSSALVNEYLTEMAKPNPPKLDNYKDKKYRVFWQGDVIGWLKEPKANLPSLSGSWSHTVNPKGKEFKKSFSSEETYEVIVEGYPVYKAKLMIKGNEANLEILSDVF